MAKHTKINLEQLTLDIKTMSNRSQLSQVLKHELTKLDHWKNQSRGKPRKKWEMKDVRAGITKKLSYGPAHHNEE